MDSKALSRTPLGPYKSPKPKVNHAHECNCLDCTVLYMLLPQEIDLEEDISIIPRLPQVPSDHPAECDCLECILPQKTSTDLEEDIITPQVNHPHQCHCADCTFLYMLLSQKVIDLEEDISIVPSSPTSRTTTLYVLDSDSDQISNVDIVISKVQDNRDIDNIVPGLQTPYSPPPSPSMFESNHLAFPNYMYGVDTPLSPRKSP